MKPDTADVGLTITVFLHVVDHYITQRLRIWLSLLRTDVSQKCAVQDLKNGVGLGWKSRVRNSVTCWFMTMVFDDKCTVEACCCFQQETGSCCTPCKSHATLHLIGPACCAWPGLCKRSSTSSGLLLQSHTCKKWVEKVKIWSRQPMSHFQDANASKVRLWCWTGWLSPFANTRCHLPTGEKDTIYL